MNTSMCVAALFFFGLFSRFWFGWLFRLIEFEDENVLRSFSFSAFFFIARVNWIRNAKDEKPEMIKKKTNWNGIEYTFINVCVCVRAGNLLCCVVLCANCDCEWVSSCLRSINYHYQLRRLRLSLFLTFFLAPQWWWSWTYCAIIVDLLYWSI